MIVSPKRLAFEKAWEDFEFEVFSAASVRVLLKAVPVMFFMISALVSPEAEAAAAGVGFGIPTDFVMSVFNDDRFFLACILYLVFRVKFAAFLCVLLSFFRTTEEHFWSGCCREE